MTGLASRAICGNEGPRCAFPPPSLRLSGARIVTRHANTPPGTERRRGVANLEWSVGRYSAARAPSGPLWPWAGSSAGLGSTTTSFAAAKSTPATAR